MEHEPITTLEDRREDNVKWRTEIEARLDAGAEKMQRLGEDLKTNTEATNAVRDNTSEVVELLKSFKGAFYVLDKLGKLAKPIGYIVAVVTGIIALVAAIKGGGPPK